MGLKKKFPKSEFPSVEQSSQSNKNLFTADFVRSSVHLFFPLPSSIRTCCRSDIGPPRPVNRNTLNRTTVYADGRLTYARKLSSRKLRDRHLSTVAIVSADWIFGP